LHARGGSRTRYGTIKGKSFPSGFAAREGSRVHRMSPGALSKVNTWELLPAEEEARILSFYLPFDFICRFIYEV